MRGGVGDRGAHSAALGLKGNIARPKPGGTRVSLGLGSHPTMLAEGREVCGMDWSAGLTGVEFFGEVLRAGLRGTLHWHLARRLSPL